MIIKSLIKSLGFSIALLAVGGCAVTLPQTAGVEIPDEYIFATTEEMEQIYAAKSRVFNACPQAQPMPGAARLLQSLKELGLTIVLVTGSAQHSLLTRLAQDFPGIFSPERMVTAFDVKHGKPHPEPYLMGLAKAGVSATEAVVIENAPLGVEAAHAAGIYTIAVNTGPLSPKVLLDAGADIVLPREGGFAQALEIINGGLLR